MKIAIVHDMIVDRGGAERVLLYFHQALPEADIFTTAYLPDSTYPDYRSLRIQSTWYDRLLRDESAYRKLYVPFGLIASRQIDLRQYDVVLQSTTHGAKYAKYGDHTLVISYCYTPFRLVWDSHSYAQVRESGPLMKFFYNTAIALLRRIDYKSAQRPDVYWAMTKETAQRIRVAYDREVKEIINPPVDCRNYYVSRNTKDYYLIVSRMESYKKIDLAIRVFNRLKLPLKIVGTGTQREYLRSISGPTIEFMERISDSDLARLYAECKAFVLPQHEDYGITALEANASGRPVLAYANGGVLETMIPYTSDAGKATALFFNQQTEESMLSCIQSFESLTFDPRFIRRHAEQFDVPVFVQKVRSLLHVETTEFSKKAGRS